MNTKKKTVLAAALVVAIIALAGVGYAAFNTNYTGTTQSDTTTYDVDWVKVTLDSYGTVGPADTYMLFDTVNNAGTISYYWNGSTIVTRTATVTIPADAASSNDRDTFTLSITAGAAPSGYTLQYKVDNENEWHNYSGAIEKTILTASATSQNVTISYRAVPEAIADTALGVEGEQPDEHILVADIADPASTVVLPALKFTVTGEQ